MTFEIKKLNYYVEKKQLLNDIDVSIEKPKLIGIIGANGAGKSTLLNCMSALNNSHQCISINGEFIESYTSLQMSKMRAALPQQSSLSFPFSAEDIVGMSFTLSTMPKEKQNKIIKHCLRIMSAIHLAKRNYLNLSGGEKQRIQIARVIAQLIKEDNQLTRYLLLDEPTAPLDLKYQYQLFDYLKEMTTKNIAVIVVIHDLNLAASYCDELWVMSQGKLIKTGKPSNVISKNMLQEVFDINVEVIMNNQTPQIQRVI
jgi:iron complex transport system ATP-binding protein